MAEHKLDMQHSVLRCKHGLDNQANMGIRMANLVLLGTHTLSGPAVCMTCASGSTGCTGSIGRTGTGTLPAATTALELAACCSLCIIVCVGLGFVNCITMSTTFKHIKLANANFVAADPLSRFIPAVCTGYLLGYRPRAMSCTYFQHVLSAVLRRNLLWTAQVFEAATSSVHHRIRRVQVIVLNSSEVHREL